MNLQEINALVAEKVMGWKLQKLEHADFWMDEQGGWVLKQLWKPSTDIRDAWLVVDKFNYNLKLELNGGYCTCRLVGDFDERMVGQYFYAEADTAPLAICLAALKAVGVEVEGIE